LSGVAGCAMAGVSIHVNSSESMRRFMLVVS
jgi:hypothetical protein